MIVKIKYRPCGSGQNIILYRPVWAHSCINFYILCKKLLVMLYKMRIYIKYTLRLQRMYGAFIIHAHPVTYIFAK